jgi:FlaA1/EpsC-like NDP-sugar epimerase
VQTDSFHAPYPAQNPASPFSWAEVVGREPATSDPILIPSVAGQRVLVTGAGGFIGSAMVRVLAASGALQIILLEIAEQQLFAIFNELSQRGHADRCIPILGSVCDRALLTAVFDEHHPELVIRAAHGTQSVCRGRSQQHRYMAPRADRRRASRPPDDPHLHG